MIQIASKYGDSLSRLTADIKPINKILYNEIPAEDKDRLCIINQYINEDCDNLIADIMLKINRTL